MKKFLRFLLNIAIIAISFIGYGFVQRLYVVPQKTHLTIGWAAVIAAATVIGFWVVFYLYKYQLSKENDWFFNAKPHWDVRRVLIAFGSFFLIIVAQLLFIRFIGGNGVSENQAALEELQKQTRPIFNIMLVIVAPIFEELIFRGMFFNTFFPVENKTTKVVGILTSGLVFGLAHDPTFSKFIILYWVMGSILAWTYVTTRDIRYSIIAHMLNNLISIL